MTRSIYFVCGHLTHLALFAGLSEFLRGYFPGVKQNLILTRHPYFARIDTGEYLSGYDTVNEMTQCESAFTSRWSTTLSPGCVRERMARTRRFLNESKRFTFEEGALCLFSDMSDTSLAERLLLRKIRSETRRAKVCRVGVGLRSRTGARSNNWLMSFLHNIYAVLGAPSVAVQLDGSQVSHRTFYRESEVYDRLLVYATDWGDDPSVLQIKYPLLPAPESEKTERPYVLYVGHGLGSIKLFPDMSEQTYIATTNSVLKKLTELYEPHDVDLYYKPHPTEGSIPFDLSGFVPFTENLTTEALFRRDRTRIMAVYAVASTSLATASLFGIEAYSLINLHRYPLEMRQRTATKILDYANVVAPDGLDEMTRPTPIFASRAGSSTEDLERAARVFGDLMNVTPRTR